ncbi:6006_t:CDS:2, partial [Gigaspora rosea]
TDTLSTFKNAVATKFKIPINQMRFWIIKKQDNINFRLHDLMTDDLLNTSMDKIRLTHYDDLKFYIEVYEKLTDVKVVNQVAIYLNIDPSKLRFTRDGEPTSEIDYMTIQTLSKMF